MLHQRLGSVPRLLVAVRFTVWGMSGTLLVSDPTAEVLAHETLWSWVQRADHAINRFVPTSEISRLNAKGSLDNASDDFLMFLQAAQEVSELTNGLCDPTVLPALLAWGYDRDFEELSDLTPVVPEASLASAGIASVTVADRRVTSVSGLDFGASAKAFVADAIAVELESRTGVLVEIGGDVAVRTMGSEAPWAIGVAPDGPDERAPRISVASGGVATSSMTHRVWSTSKGRAHHIIDPRTGRPATSRWAAITVAAPSCLYANALATAGFLWDEEAPWHIGQTGWAGRLVGHDGDVVTVGSWPKEDA